MNRSVFITLASLLCAAVTQAEPRTFTNTEGKSIKADLVRVEGENAVLKLANLSVAKVPLASLSKADEAYVKAWWEDNKDNIGAMDFQLAIDKNTKRIDRKRSRSGGNGGGGNNQFSQVVTKMQKNEIQYACILKSYVKKEISDITVNYTIYKRVSTRDKDGSKLTVEETDGTTSIKSIKALGSATFETDVMPCESNSQTGGNGPSTKRSETVEGFVVTLSVAGKEFLKQCYPDNYIERLEEKEKREDSRPLR